VQQLQLAFMQAAVNVGLWRDYADDLVTITTVCVSRFPVSLLDSR
jgi:hypothetical protein